MIEIGQDSGGYEILANSVEYAGAVIVSADIFTEGASGNLMERVTLRYERADFRDEINGSTCTVRPKYSRISNPVTELSEGYTFLSPDKDYRMYMAVTGERQGRIEGSYIGRSGAYDKTIPAYAYSAGIKVFEVYYKYCIYCIKPSRLLESLAQDEMWARLFINW